MTLGCPASGSGPRNRESRPRGIQVGGRTLSELTKPISTALPKAKDVGVHPPPALNDWYFLKAPIVLEAGAGPLTLSLNSYAEQRLAWVPGDVWTSGQPPNLTDWTTTKLTLTGCTTQTVTYYGGILTKTASGCARLHVGSPSEPAADYTWTYGTQHCALTH